MRKAKKMLQDVPCEEVQDVEKNVLKIADFKLCNLLICSRGEYSQKNWVGVCGPLPKTLTLFMTKICDFPYPMYDLTKNLIPYL